MERSGAGSAASLAAAAAVASMTIMMLERKLQMMRSMRIKQDLDGLMGKDSMVVPVRAIQRDCRVGSEERN
jgi:hypothetical protein